MVPVTLSRDLQSISRLQSQSQSLTRSSIPRLSQHLSPVATMVSARTIIASTAMVAGVFADPWPKRGLAANDDVPIWQFGGEWNGHHSQVNWMVRSSKTFSLLSQH